MHILKMLNGIYKVFSLKFSTDFLKFLYSIAFVAKREAVIYECCPAVYPFVLFTIQIRRRTLYYVVNVVGKLFVRNKRCL
jgi:hypothetical protein